MAHIELQEAISRLETDESYRETLAKKPNQIQMDFRLNDEQTQALYSSESLEKQIDKFRPTAFCCCTCIVASKS